MKDMNAIVAMLDKAVHDTHEEYEKRMAWLREYAERGNGMSHIAAGEALAAAILTAAVLDGTPEVIRGLLHNSRAGHSGREDFRFDFARCSIQKVLKTYAQDDLLHHREYLDQKSGVDLLADLVQSLAYESGQLAEDIGFPPSML